MQANSAAGSALLSALGLNLQDTTAQLGLGCSPLSVVGVGSGSQCKSNAVCCENNNVVSNFRYFEELDRDTDTSCALCRVAWFRLAACLSRSERGGLWGVELLEIILMTDFH